MVIIHLIGRIFLISAGFYFSGSHNDAAQLSFQIRILRKLFSENIQGVLQCLFCCFYVFCDKFSSFFLWVFPAGTDIVRQWGEPLFPGDGAPCPLLWAERQVDVVKSCDCFCLFNLFFQLFCELSLLCQKPLDIFFFLKKPSQVFQSF